MSHIKQNPPLVTGDSGKLGREANKVSTPNLTTEHTPLSSLDPAAVPPTAKQVAFASQLIVRRGKTELLAAKKRAGIPLNLTLMRLSKAQISRLINELKQAKK